MRPSRTVRCMLLSAALIPLVTAHEARAAVAPISPVVAFPHDHRPFNKRSLATSDGRTIPYSAMLNWIALATALHLPATTVPAGLAASGLPVGAQLIGPPGGDARTLALAQAIDENVRGFVAPRLASIVS